MFQRQALFVFLFLLAVAWGNTARAGYPSYLILQTPYGGPRQVSKGYNVGTAVRVSTPAYAYGYFGVEPRKHASKHFGFYHSYHECSCR